LSERQQIKKTRKDGEDEEKRREEKRREQNTEIIQVEYPVTIAHLGATRS
jgi:hypothetical protein